MKVCRKCSVELVVGGNWLISQVKHYSYICNDCREEYRDEKKEHIKETKKKYYGENKDKLIEHSKEWYHDNKAKKKEYDKEYITKPENKKKRNERENIRRQTDVNYKMAINLRNRMRKAIRTGQKAGSAVEDLGISIEAFKMYLAEQFEDGMTWENYGTLWHIDHIEPLRCFDLTNRDQFLEAANWMNLRPLWAIDNLKKISEDKKKSIRRNNNG